MEVRIDRDTKREGGRWKQLVLDEAEQHVRSFHVMNPIFTGDSANEQVNARAGGSHNPIRIRRHYG
jgi:hypothetical protein